MKQPAVPVMRNLQIGLACTLQAIGWAGLVGLALMAAAGLVFALAWSTRSMVPVASPAQPRDAVNVEAQQTAVFASPQTLLELSPPNDIPLLLTQIKQIALNNGLGWTTAEYRITSATDSQPASLELRSNFKAPYPKLRNMVSQVIHEVPAAALRELSLNRASSDSADVDAKVVFAVLLKDAVPPFKTTATPAGAKATP